MVKLNNVFKTGIMLLALIGISTSTTWGQNSVILATPSSANPINVGIGTLAPTTQLHTTGGVRFTGIQRDNTLNRVLVRDANGNLAWRDANTIGNNNGNFWSLAGNAITNPTTEFLGTTNNNRLVFRTNNTEKMTILPNGNMGLGNTNPNGLLTVGDGAFNIGQQTNQDYTFQLLGKRVNAVEHLGMFNNNQATSRSELTVSNSATPGGWADNFVAIMVHGNNFSFGNKNDYYLGQNNSGYALINAQSNATANVPLRKFSIGVASNNIPLSFYTNNTERIFISPRGRVGISTIDPTAGLHINCTGIPLDTSPSNIRFQNLQTLPTNIPNRQLVIDNNGFVYATTAMNARTSAENIEFDELKNTLAKQNAIITELQDQLKTLSEKVGIETSNLDLGKYINVYPNPAESETVTLEITELGWKYAEVFDASQSQSFGRYDNGGDNKIEVKIPTQAGVYIVSVYTNKGVVAKKILR